MKISKSKLKALLRQETEGMQVTDVILRHEPSLGWSAAFLVDDPALADDYQLRFFEIETELRSKYELGDGS